MAFLNRESILGSVSDIRTRDVNVPEWGGTVRVRQMTVAERNAFARKKDEADKGGVGAWLLCELCVDENGQRLFKPEDIEALQQRSFIAVDRVIEGILEVNELGKAQVEEAAKN